MLTPSTSVKRLYSANGTVSRTSSKEISAGRENQKKREDKGDDYYRNN
jgi:hypothetical protein